MAYLRSIGAGGFVDAAPVRERVRYLHDQLGVSYDVIAERSGADVETVKLHYRGWRWPDRVEVPTCTMETRRKILGARFTPSDGYRFGAVGIRRRLQALQYAGFSLGTIASLVDRDIRQVHAMMSGKTNKHFVRRELAEAVCMAYDKLQTADPYDWEDNPRTPSYTRNRARKNGYVPATCWDPDTIDDPDALPEWTGQCGTHAGNRIHTRDKIPMCPPCEAVGDGNPKFSPALLKALRVSKGLTQPALEKLAGLGNGAVHYWESGRNLPRRGNLERALVILDATFEDVCE